MQKEKEPPTNPTLEKKEKIAIPIEDFLAFPWTNMPESFWLDVWRTEGEIQYLRKIVGKINSHEKVSVDLSYKDAYDTPRERKEDCHRFPDKDVYTNKRVGKYNELTLIDEVEGIQYDIAQVSAWFEFTSDLARRVYHDDWKGSLIMRSQGRLLHYYILFKFDKKLTADALGIEINSLDHNLRRLFKKLDSFPLLNEIIPKK